MPKRVLHNGRCRNCGGTISFVRIEGNNEGATAPDAEPVADHAPGMCPLCNQVLVYDDLGPVEFAPEPEPPVNPELPTLDQPPPTAIIDREAFLEDGVVELTMRITRKALNMAFDRDVMPVWRGVGSGPDGLVIVADIEAVSSPPPGDPAPETPGG
jgi:hypothetical protein